MYTHTITPPFYNHINQLTNKFTDYTLSDVVIISEGYRQYLINHAKYVVGMPYLPRGLSVLEGAGGLFASLLIVYGLPILTKN